MVALLSDKWVLLFRTYMKYNILDMFRDSLNRKLVLCTQFCRFINEFIFLFTNNSVHLGIPLSSQMVTKKKLQTHFRNITKEKENWL